MIYIANDFQTDVHSQAGLAGIASLQQIFTLTFSSIGYAYGFIEI